MKENPSLFKYELALTLIVKNAAPYMREWIDYHRLAGVDHFYFYDNDSSDNLVEVLQPYIQSGVVEYTALPGQRPQCAAYNDAVKHHRFECRYMGFIDDDEFLLPTDTNRTVKDVLHMLLDDKPNVGALTLNSYMFGSSGHETADYDVPVLERYQRRAVNMPKHPKVIANPRLIDFVDNPHYMNLFDEMISVNTRGETNTTVHRETNALDLQEPSVEHLVINHYHCKSREDYANKNLRGDGFFVREHYTGEQFDEYNSTANAITDDNIVKYRDARRSVLEGGGGRTPSEPQHVMYNRIFNAMLPTISQGMAINFVPKMFNGKLHEFLTCRVISRSLDGNLLDSESANFFEELSIKCIERSLRVGVIQFRQVQMLIKELPSILRLKYPAVDKLRNTCVNILPQIMMSYRMRNNWKPYTQYDYLLDILKGSA